MLMLSRAITVGLGSEGSLEGEKVFRTAISRGVGRRCLACFRPTDLIFSTALWCRRSGKGSHKYVLYAVSNQVKVPVGALHGNSRPFDSA